MGELIYRLSGGVEPLIKGEVGGDYTRPIAGWLTTYGQIADDGSIVPTFDRTGQLMECARTRDGMVWRRYLSGGWLNDRHDRKIIIGRPLVLEALNFYDETTPFGQEHRKVGWYGRSILFDPDDTRSFGGYKPTDYELERANWYHDRREEPGSVGHSVDGLCKVSADQKRIIWADIDQVALHPTPYNPDASVEEMGAPLELLQKGGPDYGKILESARAKKLIKQLMEHYGLSEEAAKEFIRRRLALSEETAHV